jgi:hypothetical protein
VKAQRAAPLLLSCALLPSSSLPAEKRVEVVVEERVRLENWENAADLDDQAPDETRQLRFRTRFGASFKPGPKLELMALFNNESRNVMEPETPFTWDELIFETLYLDYRFGDRWSARLGRQNLRRGEGFVLFEGNALDGSRTTYFNALDVSYAPDAGRLELIALSNPREESYLPAFNDRHRPLTEWDERALGLYFTRDRSGATLEAYYFYKTESDDPRPPTEPGFQPDRTVQTLGARFARQLGKGWAVAAEGAGQWGRADPATDLGAWGGYLRVKRLFDAPGKPSLSLGYVAMSGDDPATSRIEGWDPPFSRWPLWSELYIYNLAEENGVAYWTNLGMWQAEFLIAPIEPLDLRATYYKMRAFHPFPGDPAIFGSGEDRGDIFEVRLDLKLPPHWSGHLLYEGLDPGDFYSARDRAWFLRAEVIYSFKRRWPP